MIVLVDTNMLLDVLQKRPPFHVSADRLWEAVAQGRLKVTFQQSASTTFSTFPESKRLSRFPSKPSKRCGNCFKLFR